MRTIILFLLLGLTVLSGHTAWSQTSSSGKRKPYLAQYIITSNVAGTISIDKALGERQLPADSALEVWLSKGKWMLNFKTPSGMVFTEVIRVKKLKRTEYKLDIKQKATEVLVKEITVPYSAGYLKIDWELINKAIQTGANVNATNQYRQAALMWAVSNDQIETIELLLGHGADPNAKDTLDYMTALAWAQSPEAIKLLLAHGADVNATNPWGRTPLMSACYNGRTEVVRTLLDNGAEINAADKSNWTALLGAVNEGKLEVVKLLLERGANANAISRERKSALIHAYENARWGRGNRTLNQEYWEIVKYLLEFGPEPNAADLDRMLLETASDRLDIVKLLLEKGANVDAKDQIGWTALTVAIAYRKIENVKLILAHNADVNITDREGRSCLMHAHSLDIVKMLMEKGADIHGRDSLGRSVLWHAVDENNPDIVRLLLDSGVEVNSLTNYGGTALMNADSKNLEIGKMLIAAGAEVNHASNNGWTALMAASSASHYDLVKLLLEKGADINARDKRGKTALKYARTKKIKQLLRSYAAKH